MTFFGIDPGITGAIAALRSDGSWISFWDTPTYQDGKRTRMDIANTIEILRELKDKWTTNEEGWGVMFFVEKSQPMPKNGCIAAFSLAYSFAAWVTALTALRLPFELATPQSWKKALMAGEPKEKDASRIVAIRLFPHAAAELGRKKDHGRSDALLIAEFGRRRFGGGALHNKFLLT